MSDEPRKSYAEMNGCRCGCRVKPGVDEGPEKQFSVIEYTNNQGSRIIAALDKDAYWNVLCLAEPGHIHYFKWTHAELAFDAGDSATEMSTR